MKHAVITGSSSGIGLGTAREFLKNGFSVTISGRNEKKLISALDQLIKEFNEELVLAKVCDVRSSKDIESLWDAAFEQFGRVDIWVNNAGTGQEYKVITDLNENDINDIIDINIKGLIQCSRIVLKRMGSQGFGAIYNMEGFGSDGRKMAKLGVYGTSKSAVTYFTKSLIKETKTGKVIIGLISPGMVITELFLRPTYENEKEAKAFLRIANILADKVETVTPWLVDKMIRNKVHGKRFNWLNNGKAGLRFVRSMFKKRKILSESDITIHYD